MAPSTMFLGIFFFLASASAAIFHLQDNHHCDTIGHGYICEPNITQYWGQYSPYFSVPSKISPHAPEQCTITFAQVLSRHGARNPTGSKSQMYGAFVDKLKSQIKSFKGKYAFLANYNYTLGADQLTTFGQQELVNSGIQFYHRYRKLARNTPPFVRSSGGSRVVESAQNWTQGFHYALLADKSHEKDSYPYNIVVISEDDGSNNTLDHGLCTTFEDGPDSEIGNDAQKKFMTVFIPPILTRLNADLPGLNISQSDIISFMDLCAFNTVASPTGEISPFCNLFSTSEWHSYDYYESLGKYYGHGPGNPLGPTQGVGFVNELIARLTNSQVHDSTSTNRTLDSNQTTFPTDKAHTLFADFSHDNTMTGIMSALGLFNTTKALSNSTIESTTQTNGYSASWTVPFAGRVYVEKLQCRGNSHGYGLGEELVRILVNDRVMPLPQCDGNALGLCTLSAFVQSLSFASDGGLWNQCFKQRDISHISLYEPLTLQTVM